MIPHRISVVIPACNRPAELRECLASLSPDFQQIDPANYEVIVSDDSAAAEVQSMLQREFAWVRWIKGPQRGPAANRNAGAALALGEWLVFTDDDCRPDANWLRNLDAAMNRGVDMLEGRTACPDSKRHFLEEIIENPRGGNFWSCNLAVRREVFGKLGGFDEDFHEAAQEDTEFAARARSAGVKMQFVPDAMVYHPVRRLTLVQLWRRALMIRWFSLYLLKTRPGWAKKSPASAMLLTALERTANLLRTNLHLVRAVGECGSLKAAFHIAWNSVTFPLVFPWVLYWEIRFRKMLAERNYSESVRVQEAAAG